MLDPLTSSSTALGLAVLLLSVSVVASDEGASEAPCSSQTTMNNCQNQSEIAPERGSNLTSTLKNDSVLDAKCSRSYQCGVQSIDENPTTALREEERITTRYNGFKETEILPTTEEVDTSASSQQLSFEITSQAFTLSKRTTAAFFAVTEKDPQIVSASDDTLDLPTEENGTNESLNTLTPQGQQRYGQGLVSEKTYSLVFEISNIGAITATTVSVPANLINLLVYVQPSMRSASTTYLVAMSATELLHGILVSSISYMGLVEGTPEVYSYEYLTYIHFAGSYGSSVIQRAVFWLMAFVSAERFAAVAFPIRAMQSRLVRNPAAICVITLVVLAAVHFHVAAKYDIVRDRTTNATSYTLRLTDFAQKSQMFYHVAGTLTRAVFVYPPVLATLALTLGTVFSLKRHRKATAHLARGTKRAASDTQMTVTIVASTFVSALLALPVVLQSEVGAHHPLYGFNKQEHYLFLLLNVLSLWLVGVNNNTNFVVYLLISSRYRATLRRLLGFQRCRQG